MGGFEENLRKPFPSVASSDAIASPDGPVHGAIDARVRTRESLTQAEKESLSLLRDSRSEFVDWFPPRAGDTRDRTGQRRSRDNADNAFGTYAISRVSEEIKYTDWTKDCINVAVVGLDRKMNRNVSFLIHVSIDAVLSIPEGGTFLEDMRATVKEFLQRADPGTVDVALCGGVFSDDVPGFSFEKDDAVNEGDMPRATYADEYEIAIGVLEIISQQLFEIEPQVAVAPTMREWDVPGSDVILDAQRRRLDVVRFEQPDGVNIPPFLASEIRERVAEWKAKGWDSREFRGSKGIPRP